MMIDPTALTGLLSEFMSTHEPPPHVLAMLSTAPRAEYGGPADNGTLIQAMFDARMSVGVALGGRCSLTQLLQGDPVCLDSYGGDRSALDAALAQHLAFWTGCHGERIADLMRLTPWVRDKWDRDDYLPRTIAKACSLQVEVYHGGTGVRAAPATEAEWNHAADLVVPPPAPLPVGKAILGTDYARFFDGVVHVEERPGTLWSQRHERFLDRASFQMVFGGRHFALAHGIDHGDVLKKEPPTDDAWRALSHNQFWRCPRANATAFRPELPSGAMIHEEGHTLLNTWVPITVVQTPGDASPFTAHVARLLPDPRDQAILMAYMAACVQHIGTKLQWAPLIQGVEGNGKTFIGACVSHAVGLRYTHVPNAADIGNRFNAWLERKLFIVVEEIYVADRRETLDALKPLITNERMEIQGKGRDQVTGDNRASFMLFTNHKDAWPMNDGSRRIAPFFCAQQTKSDLETSGMGGDYFPKLWGWAKKQGGWEIINWYLHNYPIPDELNPSYASHRAPATSSTIEAVEESLSPAAREVRDGLDVLIGFKGGFVSSNTLTQVLKAGNYRSKPQDVMMELGYIRHPGLPGGRTNNVVMPDGKRATLYVRQNSPVAAITGPAEIARRYTEAQSR